jgi:hypothetical protein
VATTLYQKRHPGIVIVESESTGLDPAIRIILLTGFISLTLLFIGFLLISNRLYSEEAGLEQQLRVLDGSDEVA